MNDVQRTAILAWLLQHAEFGKLPDHITAEGRAYGIRFLQAAINVTNKKKSPEKLAVITQGTLEGEFNG